MFYLNSPVADGGETTFPLAEGKARVALQSGEIAIEQDVEIEKGSSKNTCTSASNESLVYVPTVIHPGMPECSKGLRVKPFKGGGALFYHKHGDGSNDEKSSHGGCPPLSAEAVTGRRDGTSAARGAAAHRLAAAPAAAHQTPAGAHGGSTVACRRTSRAVGR